MNTREQYQTIWAMACAELFATILERMPDVAMDGLSIIVLSRGPKYFEHTEAIVKSLVFFRTYGVPAGQMEVLLTLLDFYASFLKPNKPDYLLPTCAEVERWYADVHGKVVSLRRGHELEGHQQLLS